MIKKLLMWLALAALLAFITETWLLHRHDPTTPPKPSAGVAYAAGPNQVEFIGTERVEGSRGEWLTGASYERLHDKASGAEVLCFFHGRLETMTCVTTGRNWK